MKESAINEPTNDILFFRPVSGSQISWSILSQNMNDSDLNSESDITFLIVKRRGWDLNPSVPEDTTGLEPAAYRLQ